MSNVEWTEEDSSQFTPEIAARAVAQIQADTPEGFTWSLRVGYDFGTHVRVKLKKPSRMGISLTLGCRQFWVNDETTPAIFEESILGYALQILEERQKLANPTDWDALAKKLQDALNGKTD